MLNEMFQHDASKFVILFEFKNSRIFFTFQFWIRISKLLPIKNIMFGPFEKYKNADYKKISTINITLLSRVEKKL